MIGDIFGGLSSHTSVSKLFLIKKYMLKVLLTILMFLDTMKGTLSIVINPAWLQVFFALMLQALWILGI